MDQDKDPGFQCVQQVCTGIIFRPVMKSELPACLPTYKTSLPFPSHHLPLIPESPSPTGHPAKLPTFSIGTVASLCWGLTIMGAGLGRGHGLDDDVRLNVVHGHTVTSCCTRTHRYFMLCTDTPLLHVVHGHTVTSCCTRTHRYFSLQ